MLGRLATLFSLICFSGTAVFGESSSIDDAIEFTVGNCYRSIDDISRVKSFARLMKWQELSPDVLNMVKPVEGTDYTGWRVDYKDQIFLVAINRGSYHGHPMEVCTTTINQPATAIVSRLINTLRAHKLNEDTDGVQTTEIYELQDHPVVDQAFMTVVRAVDGRAPVTIGFLGSRK